ncbi:zinc finger and BTB domain-containing protein 39 isoform X2 [Gallus gallus]|uniref:Tachykinin 3 n=1 Tax=Gallus gallus TaxID=9031 RepID=A0A8K1AZF7_CHICK|nr:tachykinin 3 precursor [Gallus gallus]XP_040549977.1 zinc finger and BTB domain-containing protein 39 isoform X2 [Gallus gallus]QVY47378.1 tachykinin 3 precursor [Gallus gallus]|eukprot:XP_015155892.1 tachykinin-3 isoform X1 [Gallus gallus]
MRSRALLAVLALALPFALSAPPGSAPRSQRGPGPEQLSWRARGSPGAAVAALLQLLREEENGPPAPAPPQKRDMHDFFVGLMGKRAAEPGRAAGGGGGAARAGHADRGPSARCSPGPPPDGVRAAGPPRPAP